MKSFVTKHLPFLSFVFGEKKQDSPDNKMASLQPDEKLVRIFVSRSFISGNVNFLVKPGDYVVRNETDSEGNQYYVFVNLLGVGGKPVGAPWSKWDYLVGEGIVEFI